MIVFFVFFCDLRYFGMPIRSDPFEPVQNHSNPFEPVQMRKILTRKCNIFAYPYPFKPVPVRNAFNKRSKCVQIPFATRSEMQ